MLTGPSALLLLISTAAICTASVCPRGKQYLDIEKQECVNCTVCDSVKGLVVLRPCDVHKDTVCGPIEKLKLLLELLHTDHNEHPHRHHRNRHRKHKERLHANVQNDAITDANLEKVALLVSETSSTEAPFTNAENLVWDWQDITLTMAVFACILFFLVIALYSLHQAKQWRKLKENFDAGEFDNYF